MNCIRILIFLMLNIPACSYTAEEQKYINLAPFKTVDEAIDIAKQRKTPEGKLRCPATSCRDSKATYSGRPNLSNHLRGGQMHSTRPFGCSLCSKHYGRRAGLTRHLRSHTDPTRKWCRHCLMAVSSHRWEKHQKHHGKKNACQYCSKVLHKPFNCRRHEKRCRKRPNSKQVQEASGNESSSQAIEQRQADELLSPIDPPNTSNTDNVPVLDLDTPFNSDDLRDLPDPTLVLNSMLIDRLK